MRKWQRILLEIVHQIWFRAALFSVAAIALALVAAVMAPVIPYDISASIGAKAVDNILGILASSMLAVTTFSLTAMVQAFSTATSNITPRATQLLVADARAQNALSTFLGAFLFAIVGICALSTGLYGDTGRVILFGGTIVVIAIIVITLLNWISHLARFGRMEDTIARVEKAATKAADYLACRPHFGGERPGSLPEGASPVLAPGIGWITHVDVRALGDVIDEHGGSIHVTALPGDFVSAGQPVAWVKDVPEKAHDRVVEAFTVDAARRFSEDPRFGLIVLSEIASRALSPAVNDPGTAIAVLGAGLRVLGSVLDPARTATVAAGVHVPGIAFVDLVEDLMRPIARDGAGLIEVQLFLHRTFGSLAQLAPGARDALRAQASEALARAQSAMDADADRQRLRTLYATLWDGA